MNYGLFLHDKRSGMFKLISQSTNKQKLEKLCKKLNEEKPKNCPYYWTTLRITQKESEKLKNLEKNIYIKL